MLELETIYQEYFRFVWACTRRLGVGDADIDDVVQEIFLVIHSRLHTVRDPAALRSWIYGIIRRTVSGHRRAGKARLEHISMHPDVSVFAGPGPSPQDSSEQNSQRALLERLLASLSEAKREVFILAELEEMSMPEVAVALEIPLNTAYSRLRHARADFEAALTRQQAKGGKP